MQKDTRARVAVPEVFGERVCDRCAIDVRLAWGGKVAVAVSSRDRKAALLAAERGELDALRARGVRMAGNAFSSIVLVKGSLNEAELSGAPLLSGADGTALRAALLCLGYPPEDFCALAALGGPAAPADMPDGATSVVAAPAADAGAPLPPELFREVLEALDPECVVLLDEAAADVMREAYADALSAIEQFEVAMLMPGLVASVLGRRVLALGGFEAALSDPAAKQRAWAYLKQVPPAGAPY